jgi:hypothetical protein
MGLIRHIWNILAEKRKKEKFFLKLSNKNDRKSIYSGKRRCFFAWDLSDLSKDISAFIFSERQSKDSSKRQKLLAKRHGLTSEKLSHWQRLMSESTRSNTQPHVGNYSLNGTVSCQKLFVQIHSLTSETIRSTAQLLVRNCSPKDTASHLSRSESSATHVREANILQVQCSLKNHVIRLKTKFTPFFSPDEPLPTS